MMHKNFAKKLMVLGMATTLPLLAGCGGGESSFLNYTKNAPDEFAVVTKSALIIPPDFNLRPPSKTAKGPQQASVQAQTKAALLGKSFNANSANSGATLSSSERKLLALAHATNSADTIRETINMDIKKATENGAKTEGNFISNMIFGKNEPSDNIINPAAEAKRIKDADDKNGAH